MLKKYVLVSALILLSQSGVLTVAEAQSGILTSGTHCVAYKTRKTVALVSSEDVIGRNCSPVASLRQEGSNLAVDVLVPVRWFNSGKGDRDQEVAKILKAQTYPTLGFRSQALPKAQWQKMAKAGQGTVSGNLTVAGRTVSVQASARAHKVGGQNWEVSGVVRTTFSRMGLEPPKVAGGVVAYAQDELELHFQLQSAKIQQSNLAWK